MACKTTIVLPLKLSLQHLQQITLFGSTGKVLIMAVEWVDGEGVL
jgi:hypothetical protein